MGIGGGGQRGSGVKVVKSYKLPVIRYISARDVMYDVIIYYCIMLYVKFVESKF